MMGNTVRFDVARFLRVMACIWCAIIVLSATAQEQDDAGDPPTEWLLWELTADQLHYVGRYDVAYEELASKRLAHDAPASAYWRLAREAISLGQIVDPLLQDALITGGDPEHREEAERWYRDAVAFSRQAVGLDSRSSSGHAYLALALLHQLPKRRLGDPEIAYQIATTPMGLQFVDTMLEMRSAATQAQALDKDNTIARQVLMEYHLVLASLPWWATLALEVTYYDTPLGDAHEGYAQSLSLLRLRTLTPYEKLVQAELQILRTETVEAKSALRDLVLLCPQSPVEQFTRARASVILEELNRPWWYQNIVWSVLYVTLSVAFAIWLVVKLRSARRLYDAARVKTEQARNNPFLKRN